jgi:hypothetical protein
MKIATPTRYKNVNHRQQLLEKTRRLQELQRANREYNTRISANDREIEALLMSIDEDARRLAGEGEKD